MTKLDTNYYNKDNSEEIEFEYSEGALKIYIEGHRESSFQSFQLSKEQTRDLLWKLSRIEQAQHTEIKGE